MPKRLRGLAAVTTESQLAVKIRESANQIWLACLGAFSKAQQEGVKMFEALVAEGEKVQERTKVAAKVAADERLAEMREKVERDLGQVREGVRGPGGARSAHLERSEPPRHRHPAEAGARTDGDHQEAVGRGRDHGHGRARADRAGVPWVRPLR